MIPEIWDGMAAAWRLEGTPWEIIRYTSVRSVAAFVVAFGFVYLLGPRLAARLYRSGMRDRVRDYDEFFNRSKSGTPTMGGLLIVGAVTLSALLFCRLTPFGDPEDPVRPIVPLLVLTTLFFGALGCIDDFLKVRNGSSDGGLSRGTKFGLQALFATFFAIMITSDGTSPFAPEQRTLLHLPFPSPQVVAPIDLAWAYGPWVIFVMVAIANAINFADGLDGLAVLPSALTAAVFGVFAYLMNHKFAAAIFEFQTTPGMIEITVFTAGLVGACVGFLWFNSYPALIIMGDTGSQALGGTIGALAILSRQELLFLVAGAVFVVEAASVLIQDYLGIRWLGRRLFFRAPAHHAFQHRGVAETKVVVRFWVASLLCAILSLATLKLR